MEVVDEGETESVAEEGNAPDSEMASAEGGELVVLEEVGEVGELGEVGGLGPEEVSGEEHDLEGGDEAEGKRVAIGVGGRVVGPGLGEQEEQRTASEAQTRHQQRDQSRRLRLYHLTQLLLQLLQVRPPLHHFQGILPALYALCRFIQQGRALLVQFSFRE